MTPLTTLILTCAAVRAAAIAALILGMTAVIPAHAASYSTAVKLACATDYFSHCSQHSVSSPGVRQCISAVGPRLTQRCINALISAGEVSRSEVDRRLTTMR